ncbi:MAG: carbohydrate kinase [Balneolaceae bacterium]|nr:carbohydrate kinase [Balneolaceae bacterium]
MDGGKKILCVGEVLWDALPSGLYLGGAPLNVCYHLSRFDMDALIASRVGDDRLGNEAVRRIKNLGIPTDLIQIDAEHETGFVKVELSETGDPQYDIVKPAAWDSIELIPDLEKTAGKAWGMVFGSLAQRNSTSRETIQKLWDRSRRLIFDMNLREPFVDRDRIHESLQVADIVKMNEEELNRLTAWYSLRDSPRDAVGQLADRFGCSHICVTRGAEGSMLYYNGEWITHGGYPVVAKDVVGAGDAFLAALLHGIIKEKEGRELLETANATGSLVARKDGATPDYAPEDVWKEMS